MNMLPSEAIDSAVNGYCMNSIFLPEFLVSTDPEFVIPANLSDNLFCEFGFGSVLSSAHTTPRDHIGSVLSRRSFYKMSGIEAGRVIASMAGTGNWPSIIGYKEGKTMNFDRLPVKRNLPIPEFILAERPNQAIVRIVCFYGLDKPRTKYRLEVGHRCSSKAMVLGVSAA